MKYLFFDIDGTLFSYKTGLVSSAVKAIAQCRQMGNKCFIATGRHLGSLQSVKGLEMDGVIYCNGAGIMLGDKIIDASPISHDLLSKTVMQFEERNGGYFLMTHDRAFVNRQEFVRRKEMCRSKKGFMKFEDMVKLLIMKTFKEYKGEEILKIDIDFPSEEVMEDFLKVMDPGFHLASTAGYNVSLGKKSGEITRSDVSKGTALQKVVEIYGGTLADAYAFGDSSNDLEMLQTAGTGIAMGNGFEEVKKAADHVTASIDEDGIAKAMYHFGLCKEV